MRYRFAEFSFDSSRNLLTRNKERVSLNPQPARLLAALLAQAPGVVRRQSLQRALWGDAAVVEFEHGLNACVRQLRTALGDSARDSRFIQTEPKVGYRFLAPVQTASTDVRRLGRLALGASLIITALVLAWDYGPGRSGEQEAPGGYRGNPAVAEMVLQAKSLRDLGDMEAMRESLARFERALALAPADAMAQAGTALNLAVLAGQPDFPAAETYARATGLGQSAITAHEFAVDAYLALGYVSLYQRWDVPAARHSYEQAQEIAPEYATGHAWLAAALLADGDSQRALAAADRAAQLEPAAWYIAADRCWYALYGRAFSRASDICRRALEQNPQSAWARIGLIEAHRQQGRREETAKLLAETFALNDADNRNLASRLPPLFCAAADKLQSNGANPYMPAYLIASLYAQCGRWERVRPWLQRALSGGESPILFYHADPRFDGYRRSEQAVEVVIAVRE
ncbi:MAG: winged helix-turn-helix domain-containing protein [Pseudomonadota bacterium]